VVITSLTVLLIPIAFQHTAVAMGGAGHATAGPFGPNDRAVCTRGTSDPF
jgi:hypothetical protein